MVAFVKARLDDDERFARLFLTIGRRLRSNPTPETVKGAEFLADIALGAPEAIEEALRWKCSAPNDLKRVLREVEAKRAVLRDYLECADAHRDGKGYPEVIRAARDAHFRDLLHIAAVWSDHPDYQQEWKP